MRGVLVYQDEGTFLWDLGLRYIALRSRFFQSPAPVVRTDDRRVIVHRKIDILTGYNVQLAFHKQESTSTMTGTL